MEMTIRTPTGLTVGSQQHQQEPEAKATMMQLPQCTGEKNKNRKPLTSNSTDQNTSSENENEKRHFRKKLIEFSALVID